MSEASADRAMKTVELLRLTEELSWAQRLASSRPPVTPDSVPPTLTYLLNLKPAAPGERSIDVLRRFTTLFADEIALVKGTRNWLVHSVDTYDDAPVDEALDVAEELVRILRKSANPDVSGADESHSVDAGKAVAESA